MRNGVNLAKRGFQPTMEQDTVFEKDLYSMSGFDAKTHFSARIGGNLTKSCFQLTIAQNTLFKSLNSRVDSM